MINGAHLHLILNHLPIIAMPITLVFLFFSDSDRSRKLAYFVLSITSLMILPVYFTGEPAEHILEHLPGINENLIESHEEAAEISMVITLIVSLAAVLGLWKRDNRKLQNTVMALVVIATLSLCYTAYLGGQIRHHVEFTNTGTV